MSIRQLNCSQTEGLRLDREVQLLVWLIVVHWCMHGLVACGCQVVPNQRLMMLQSNWGALLGPTKAMFVPTKASLPHATNSLHGAHDHHCRHHGLDRGLC